jgi:DNA polymerase-3 subunit gamma/tau
MSQYIVSARKYRPATFDSVVGQAHVTDTLVHALRSQQVAHAYLFCGPRGVGKTTVARILAKAINCENLTPEGEACNACASCQAFNVNSSFNIFELDAASNNSVDNIRALVEQVRMPPAQGKYKVYIIDEVHMLSTAAFNAFLKTLEEPPPYVKFILATTEKHKILPTILSRCQSFDFRRIPVPEIAAHLRAICAQESITAEDEGLVIIAQKGDGSLRDSLSIFDRIASQSRGNITYAGVLSSLQLLDYDFFFRVTDALLREDLTQIFLILAEIQRAGFEGEAFLSGLAEHLRDVLLCKDVATAELLTHGDKIKARYLDQAHAIRKASLVTYLDQINECEIHYDRALHKWLHIEMALVRMCYAHRRVVQDGISAGDAEKKNHKPERTRPVSAGALDESASPPSEPFIDTPPVREDVSGQPANVELVSALSASVETMASADTPIPAVPPRPAPATANGPLMVSLKDLGKLRQKAEADLAEDKKKLPVLSLPVVLEFWQAFAERHTSPSMRQTMADAILEVRNEYTLVIRTGSQTGKNRIVAESNLIDGLRSLVKRSDLTITVEIDADLDRSKEIIKPRKLLSSREKFEMLAAKNPLMQELRDRLDLIPDQDE